jgi:hypothetical protein
VALLDLQLELRGSVPKLPFAFTRTLINRAWRTVRESSLWSFNLFESSWTSPQLISSGTASVTQGFPTVQFDATAVAALNLSQIQSPYSLITQRQFRAAVSGVGGIYNIIAYNSMTGLATLDRTFGDPSITAGAYQVYQVYYTPPMQDFLLWLSVRNPQQFISLDLRTTRAEIDGMDPQRSWYQFPTHVVPFGLDLRGAGTSTPSATLNYPLFELWGQPVQLFTYQCYGIRRGTDLVKPTDTLPPQIAEDLVLAKAREYAYEWAESNKDMSPRSSGPDFRFLMGKTQDEYKKLLTLYRKQDKETVDNYYSVRGIALGTQRLGYYNTISGVAGPNAQL